MKAVAILSLSAIAAVSFAQSIDPAYAGNYSYFDLGSAPDVPTNFGGLTLLAGDANTLLLGGAANGSSGQIFAVGVTRDLDGHINGFTGTTTVFAEAPYNDGGITYGPNGVLFAARWPVNGMSEYKPGSTSPDKVIDMGALGVASSQSSVMFGPQGRLYDGKLKIGSYSGGQFYDATYAPDGSGTFDITSVTQTAQLQGGLEGFVYVPLGSALFGDAMLVSEYAAGIVSTYDVDANGDPIVASRKVFISGLGGAEGAMIDPQTGDFLFSTFGSGNHVVAVRGFASVPEPASMAALGLGCLALLRRRRSR